MTRVRFLSLALLCVLSLVPQSTWAHFVWMISEKAGEGTEVKVFFSEGPEPDAAKLLTKIASTKVVCRVTGKEALPVSLREQSQGETGSLNGTAPVQKPVSFEGVCEYGVLEKGAAPFLLKYYSRTIAADSAESFEKLAKGTLDLDIVPRRDGDQLELTVLWQGKPVEGAQVMVSVAKGADEELKTDAKGAVRTKLAAGLYSIRARHTEAKAGTLGDKKYNEAKYYSTLTFELPAK